MQNSKVECILEDAQLTKPWDVLNNYGSTFPESEKTFLL